MNVLIAEDDRVSRLLLQRGVETLGHEVHVTADGREAWNLCESMEFDVVISDWMMPNTDGLELCRLVRTQDSTAHYTYFIFVTALGDKEYFVTAMQEGADDYLSKPLDRVDLQARLASAARVTSLYREVVRQKAQLEHLALHDPLTGLPNRRLLYDRVQQASLAARRDGEEFALMLIDLDEFKEINDTFGHQYGDIVLVEVAHRLEGVLRNSDTVARLGGDEFAILLPGTNSAAARLIAEKILKVVSAPIVSEGKRLRIEASLGIARSPVHGRDPHDLLRLADMAMYEAKRNSLGCSVYAARSDIPDPAQIPLPR